MTSFHINVKPSTVPHASEQPVYATQDQAHTVTKTDAIHRGIGIPIEHFGDENGVMASLIEWQDGSQSLRIHGAENMYPKITVFPTSADPS